MCELKYIGSFITVLCMHIVNEERHVRNPYKPYKRNRPNKVVCIIYAVNMLWDKLFKTIISREKINQISNF